MNAIELYLLLNLFKSTKSHGHANLKRGPNLEVHVTLLVEKLQWNVWKG